MGVHVLHDTDEGKACLFCSTDGIAFGKCFRDAGHLLANEVAEAFLFWYQKRGDYRDPRTDPHIVLVQDKFLTEVLPEMPEECGECGSMPYQEHGRDCETADWRDLVGVMAPAAGGSR